MITSNTAFRFAKCIVALGTFDGVHIGHARVIEAAKRHGLPVVVVTSMQNPKFVLSGIGARIISPSLCNEAFDMLGVQAVIRLDFNEIKNMTPIEYLEILTDKIGAVGFACGYNFRFGKSASGTAKTISEYAKENGFVFDICDEVDIDGLSVSSTRIRDLIANGNIKYANTLLGRPYAFDFEVIHGDARGRTIGFPTLNQQYPDGYLLPKFGVYASRVTVNNQCYASITNVGIRPTFKVDQALAETTIDGFNGNLYGKHIKTELIEFIRPEKKFGSLEALKTQIQNDIESSKRI